MIEVAVLRAMADAGMNAHAIIDLIEVAQKSEAEKIARKREQVRQRVRKHRRRDVTLGNAEAALQSQKLNEINNRVTQCNASPLETPIKNLPSEEGSRIIEFAGARPEESKEGFGYSNFDGTVSFTAAEITRLSLDCYTLTNVYGQIRSLAESSWVEGMRPTDRKRAIVNKIKKNHTKRVRDFAPSPEEQKVVVQQSIESQQDELERSRQARARALGGRRVG